MILKKKNLRIATILPYKENYTYSSAQAAAIWVCDFYKYSKYNKDNFIFGNTQGKNYLTKNYIILMYPYSLKNQNL